MIHRKQNFTVALCSAFLMVFLWPLTSLAYNQATASDAQVLSSDTSLFSVTYRMSFLNREVRIPIHAARSHTDSEPTSIHYSITRNNTPYSAGVAPAIVLTDDPDVTIEDGHYVLPAGEAAEFTLYSIFRPSTTGDALYQLSIDHLPFVLVDAEGTAELSSFPEHNPADYQTPALMLGAQPFTISAEVTEITTSRK